VHEAAEPVPAQRPIAALTENRDLDVLGCIGSSEQRQPAQQPGEQQMGESERQ
jgi:hypothetical protein